MKLTKSTYSDDRAGYYQGSWEINKSGVSVPKGNLVAFNKTDIVPELVRQVQYFLTMKFNYFMYNPVNLTMTLLFFGDNFRSRNAKNTHDTSFES